MCVNVAGIICPALPRPTVYICERFAAAAPIPASAAHLYKSAAAG